MKRALAKQNPQKSSAGAAITHDLDRHHPPRRPVLVGQGKLNPPRRSDKRFLKNNFSSLPPELWRLMNGRVQKWKS
jgi:hypothetical protein